VMGSTMKVAGSSCRWYCTFRAPPTSDVLYTCGTAAAVVAAVVVMVHVIVCLQQLLSVLQIVAVLYTPAARGPAALMCQPQHTPTPQQQLCPTATPTPYITEPKLLPTRSHKMW
jgi:hypothetical protein